jgi:hypothetical protein
MAASATANKTPSGTPTYMPILLSPVEDDVEEDAAEACDVSIGWPIVVVVVRLDAEAPWDVDLRYCVHDWVRCAKDEVAFAAACCVDDLSAVKSASGTAPRVRLEAIEDAVCVWFVWPEVSVTILRSV